LLFQSAKINPFLSGERSKSRILKFGLIFYCDLIITLSTISAQLDESCRITIRFAKLDACINRDDSSYSLLLDGLALHTMSPKSF
jgi:hypothetical protein